MQNASLNDIQKLTLDYTGRIKDTAGQPIEPVNALVSTNSDDTVATITPLGGLGLGVEVVAHKPGVTRIVTSYTDNSTPPVTITNEVDISVVSSAPASMDAATSDPVNQ